MENGWHRFAQLLDRRLIDGLAEASSSCISRGGVFAVQYCFIEAVERGDDGISVLSVNRCDWSDDGSDEKTTAEKKRRTHRSLRSHRVSLWLRMRSRKSWWTRGSELSSGWKVAARRWPSRTRTGKPSRVARV